MGLDDVHRGCGSGGDKACDHAGSNVGRKAVFSTSHPDDCLLDLVICCAL